MTSLIDAIEKARYEKELKNQKNMDSFKKNITNIKKEDRDKYFQLPQDFQKYVDDKDKMDSSLEGHKKRLEKQLKERKKYVTLLERKQECLSQFIADPNEETALQKELSDCEVELFNLEIEIVAQKNIFVDTYIYYKEDFMKKYKKGGGKKGSVFTNKK